MHAMDVPPNILPRVDRDRTRRHMCQGVDRVSTVHAMVERQNGFVEPGAPMDVPVAREMVPDVNGVIWAVCRAGGAVTYFRFTTDSDALRNRSVLYDCTVNAVPRDGMAAGSGGDHHDFALWPELEVQPQDRLVCKTRYSAFVPGLCELDGRIPGAGIETPIISGSLINCCCESTARDGVHRDDETVLPSAANAVASDEAHNTPLARMVSLFADVMPTSDGLTTITAAKQRGA